MEVDSKVVPNYRLAPLHEAGEAVDNRVLYNEDQEDSYSIHKKESGRDQENAFGGRDSTLLSTDHERYDGYRSPCGK